MSTVKVYRNGVGESIQCYFKNLTILHYNSSDMFIHGSQEKCSTEEEFNNKIEAYKGDGYILMPTLKEKRVVNHFVKMVNSEGEYIICYESNLKIMHYSENGMPIQHLTEIYSSKKEYEDGIEKHKKEGFNVPKSKNGERESVAAKPFVNLANGNGSKTIEFVGR